MNRNYRFNKNFFDSKNLRCSKFLLIIAITFIILFPTIINVKADELEIEWIRIEDVGSIDEAMATAIDSESNVVITGFSYIEGDFDYYTIKYDPAGNILWSTRYDGGWTDKAYAVAIDSEDNILVTGTSLIHGDSYDYYTIKYDSNGNEIWNATFSGYETDIAYDVAVDSQDNVIVTGTHGRIGQGDYGTIKYDKNGGEIWRWFYEGTYDDIAQGVAVDSTGCVVVTGKSYFSGSWNWYTIKYDFDGTIIWDAVYDSGGNDIAHDVTVDSQDNVIVTGSSYISGNNHYYTVKYDSNGNPIWAKMFLGIGESEAYGVTTGLNDEVVITGKYDHSGFWDYYTVKYSSSGDVIWSDLHSSGWKDCGRGVAVDSYGNIVITGYSEIGDYDYYTVKYSWPNLPPVANFTFSPLLPTQNDVVEFMDQSTDPDGNIVNWTWDLGDGTYVHTENTTHQYANAGIYVVKLIVEDDDGANNTISRNVTVRYVPTVTTDVDSDGTDELAMDNDENVLNGYETYSDPNGNSNAVNSTDGDEDGKIDHFIDIDDDGNPDKYWDPDAGVLSNITYIDVDGDGTDELAYDSDGDGILDKYYDPDDETINGYDVELPSKVTGLIVTDAKDGKLSLSWNAASDNIGVDHYRIYRDGSFIKNAFGTSYLDTGLTNGNSYVYIVSAVDFSGNEGDGSYPVSGTPTKSSSTPPPPSSPPPSSPPLSSPPEPTMGKEPNTPSTPDGLLFGFINIEYIYSTSTTDPDDNNVYYFFDWGDGTNSGWVGPYSSGAIATASKTWSAQGTYYVKVKAMDMTNAESKWSNRLQVTINSNGNHPPNIPAQPKGPSIGDIYIDYAFFTNMTDLDNNTVKYEFNWGDNTSSTTDFVPSDEMISLSHNWTREGVYFIKVRAYDTHNASSNWSKSTMFVVDNVRPIVTITNPVMNAIISGSININVDTTIKHLLNVTFELIKENITIDTYTDLEAPYIWSLDTTKYDDGYYTLKVTAYDNVGNINVASSFTIRQRETASIPGTLLVGIIIAGSMVAAMAIFFKRYNITFYYKK